MKKALALVLCLIMAATIAVSAVSADDVALIDARDVRAYGAQQHIYLGDQPVSGTDIPNVEDGKVSENEYSYSWQFSKDDVAKYTAVWNSVKSDNYMDNEWVKAYVSYGEDTVYLALETKDPVYHITKDGFGMNLNLKDGPTIPDAISRICFDIYQNEDGTPKVGARYFHKQPDGSWNNPAADTGDKFIEAVSVTYDKATSILTTEIALSISAQLEHWGNDKEVADAVLTYVPFTYMYGPKVAGGEDVVSQGNLWSYYTGQDNSNIKLQFMLDYPEITYWTDWFPNIIHFCKEPDPTTPAPTTTAVPTTTPEPTTAAPTTAKPTTAAPTTAAPTDAPAATTTAAPKDEGGCGGTIALSALALVPMLGAAVVFGKKKEN